MIVFQYDYAGLYCGPVAADESPLEPGVYLIPARSTPVPPPPTLMDGKWPRWNGASWDQVTRSQAAAQDALTKLQAFLAANPDVAAML